MIKSVFCKSIEIYLNRNTIDPPYPYRRLYRGILSFTTNYGGVSINLQTVFWSLILKLAGNSDVQFVLMTLFMIPKIYYSRSKAKIFKSGSLRGHLEGHAGEQ